MKGTWKGHGFVIAVPVADREKISSIEIKGADHKLEIVEGFYVTIPSSAPDPSAWRVYIENGVLKIKPPRTDERVVFNNVVGGNARVGMQVGVWNGDFVRGKAVESQSQRSTRPTIGLALPYVMPIHNM